MGQEISQQQQQQQQPHQPNNKCNRRPPQQLPHSQKQQQQQPQQRKSYSHAHQKNLIYTPSNFSTSSCSTSTDDYDAANYRLRHKYNLAKQSYERTKILNSTNSTTTVNSDTDSNYAKIQGVKYLQRNSYGSARCQSSDSGIYNSSCHCSSLSSLSAVSSSSASSTSGCPSSLLSSKSSRSLDKQKQYLSHHLYIKSYLDILEEDERARAHFKSARPGGIRNYTPKILASGESLSTTSSTLSASAPANGYGFSATAKQQHLQQQQQQRSGSTTCKNGHEDPWI